MKKIVILMLFSFSAMASSQLSLSMFSDSKAFGSIEVKTNGGPSFFKFILNSSVSDIKNQYQSTVTLKTSINKYFNKIYFVDSKYGKTVEDVVTNSHSLEIEQCDSNLFSNCKNVSHYDLTADYDHGQITKVNPNHIVFVAP